jgi:hypothetical protein
MPLWAIVCIVGAIVAYLAHTGLGALIILIGIVLLVVDLLGGVNLRR